MKQRILGIGIATYDIIVELDEIPRADEHVFMLGSDRQAGGIVGNALAAAARLGMDCSWAGRLGSDEFGQFVMGEMKADGIDTGRVIMDGDSRTPYSIIMVDRKTRGRTILSSRGDSGHYGSQLPDDYLAQFGLMHLDGYIPDAAFPAAERARSLGVKVSIDAGLDFPGLRELIPHTDIFIPTLEIAEKLTGTADLRPALESMAAMGPEIVCITLGAKGSAGLAGGEYYFAPGFKIAALDTTAAGDTFHGAFAYAYMQGWPLKKMLTFANGVAALKCTKMGARRGIPRMNEVEAFLAENGIV